jgi:hypothetical protein
VADCVSSLVGVTEMDWILPQKEKKDLISSSLVLVEMFSTWTVVAMMIDMCGLLVVDGSVKFWLLKVEWEELL